MADKSTIGDLKAVLENSFAEMQSDESTIKRIKKDVVNAPKNTGKIEYGVVYSSEKYQEDFIVKPIAATKQTIETPLDLKEEKVANNKPVEKKSESVKSSQTIVSAPSKTIGCLLYTSDAADDP